MCVSCAQTVCAERDIVQEDNACRMWGNRGINTTTRVNQGIVPPTTDNMNMASLKLALFVLFALAARSSEAEYTCGSSCLCYDGDSGFSPGLKVAVCWWIRPVLTTVPTDLPADIQELRIVGGSIPRLSDSQFTTYRRLQLIRIYNSKIEQIEPGSFRYMTNVTDIYLDYNKISELPTECFKFSPNLVTVYLYYNKITRLQSYLFSNLKYLKQVYLYNNEINSIEEHCFAEVPQLETIHLANNKLTSLDIKFIDNPTSLKVIYLNGNPWHCDTSLCGVMGTAMSRELWSQSVPTCTTPQNLTKREWSKPLLTELCPCFWCNCTNIPPKPQPSCDVGPRIISNTSSVSEGQDLELRCQHCLSSQIVWTFNDAKLPSNYVEKSEKSLTSTLTIKNILKEQRGYYLCKIKSCEDCEDAGVYVSVTGKPQTDVDVKPVVDVPLEPKPSCDAPRIISNTSSVSEGQDLRLKCKYCVASQVVWTFNNVILPSNYVENSEQSLTSTLTITNVVRGQQGYYICKIRSCEDCKDAGVYVSVTGKPQSDVDLKQVVHVPGVNSSESCGSRRGLLLLQYTVVPATELNTTLNDKN